MISIGHLFLLTALGLASPGEKQKLRVGHFPNLTHAQGVIGHGLSRAGKGWFEERLGPNVEIEWYVYNAGPTAMEAMLAGSIDLTYVGPNPALNAYIRSEGDEIRILAGAASGGAALIVQPDGRIQKDADFKGKRIGSPQLGNTQDVALRAWLKREGLQVELRGASDVSILPQENAQTLDAFKNRQIAGAWVPEPWASRLVLEGGGKVLVDERDLWPERAYVTTHLVVRTEFLEQHPALVRSLLRAHVQAGAWLAGHEAEAKPLVNGAIARISGKKIDEKLLDAAWKNLTFTDDPIASSLKRSAQDAQAAGLLDLGGLDLAGIYDLAPLNEVLKERGLAAIRQ
jgi:NitT/TauT family transport system substrate-binding protein